MNVLCQKTGQGETIGEEKKAHVVQKRKGKGQQAEGMYINRHRLHLSDEGKGVKH